MFKVWREWLNRNSAVVTIGAVVLLIFSLAFIIKQSLPRRFRPQIVDIYYYDLGTGKVFLAKSDQTPPVEAPGGPSGSGMPMGVRAYLFACGECPTGLAGLTAEQLAAKQVFVGWLEMYTPEAKQYMEQMRRGAADESGPAPPGAAGGPMVPEMYDVMMQGQLIRAIDNDQWVPANTPEGFEIMNLLRQACPPESVPRPCFPSP